ncbi:MAG: flippase-like domain-containing protein [Ignavibacteriales bacterium]|nr:MAG: flippase-like domain-containing protein [Ignavibacteriales bacterium]
MLKKIKQKILISIAVAGLIYLAFTIYADYQQVAEAFKLFNWLLFPVLLLLSLANYFCRFFKWDYYLSVLSIKMKKIDSLSIFMSGLIMSVTPGKMGELLKAYLVKEVNGTPISKTAPIVFVERITDFVSLLFIALAGAYIYDYGREIVLAVTVFFIVVLVVLSNKGIALPLIGIAEKIKFIRKRIENIHTAYESSYLMLKPLPLVYMTLLSLCSWAFECLGYFVVLKNFNINTDMMWASFSYCFGTIVGAISLLPGGLGVTEGSLTFMLVQHGASTDVAVASTFIIRVVTLWFAVFVGVISVSFYQKRFGKIKLEIDSLRSTE